MIDHFTCCIEVQENNADATAFQDLAGADENETMTTTHNDAILTITRFAECTQRSAESIIELVPTGLSRVQTGSRIVIPEAALALTTPDPKGHGWVCDHKHHIGGRHRDVHLPYVLWRFNGNVDEDHVKALLAALDPGMRTASVLVMTNTHGGTHGYPTIAHPNFYVEDERTAFSLGKRNVRLEPITPSRLPHYLEDAEHIIEAWCHSAKANTCRVVRWNKYFQADSVPRHDVERTLDRSKPSHRKLFPKAEAPEKPVPNMLYKKRVITPNQEADVDEPLPAGEYTTFCSEALSGDPHEAERVAGAVSYFGVIVSLANSRRNFAVAQPLYIEATAKNGYQEHNKNMQGTAVPWPPHVPVGFFVPSSGFPTLLEWCNANKTQLAKPATQRKILEQLRDIADILDQNELAHSKIAPSTLFVDTTDNDFRLVLGGFEYAAHRKRDKLSDQSGDALAAPALRRVSFKADHLDFLPVTRDTVEGLVSTAWFVLTASEDNSLSEWNRARIFEYNVTHGRRDQVGVLEVLRKALDDSILSAGAVFSFLNSPPEQQRASSASSLLFKALTTLCNEAASSPEDGMAIPFCDRLQAELGDNPCVALRKPQVRLKVSGILSECAQHWIVHRDRSQSLSVQGRTSAVATKAPTATCNTEDFFRCDSEQRVSYIAPVVLVRLMSSDPITEHWTTSVGLCARPDGNSLKLALMTSCGTTNLSHTAASEYYMLAFGAPSSASRRPTYREFLWEHMDINWVQRSLPLQEVTTAYEHFADFDGKDLLQSTEPDANVLSKCKVYWSCPVAGTEAYLLSKLGGQRQATRAMSLLAARPPESVQRKLEASRLDIRFRTTKGTQAVLVSPHCPETLRDRMRRPVVKNEWLHWFLNVADDLAKLHAKKLVRIDLSPETIGIKELGAWFLGLEKCCELGGRIKVPITSGCLAPELLSHRFAEDYATSTFEIVVGADDADGDDGSAEDSSYDDSGSDDDDEHDGCAKQPPGKVEAADIFSLALTFLQVLAHRRFRSIAEMGIRLSDREKAEEYVVEREKKVNDCLCQIRPSLGTGLMKLMESALSRDPEMRPPLSEFKKQITVAWRSANQQEDDGIGC